MKKAFTLIELLVVAAILAVVGVVAVTNLAGNRNQKILTSTTQDIAATLRQAESDSMSQSQGASWGVHFDNTSSTAPFYTLFYTTNGSYTSSTQVGYYPLPSGICYATSSVLGGSSTSIIFSSLTGGPSASTTITLQLMTGGGCAASSSGLSGSVSRSASGKIFFDDFNRSIL